MNNMIEKCAFMVYIMRMIRQRNRGNEENIIQKFNWIERSKEASLLISFSDIIYNTFSAA